jgi:hypothetical protein
MFILAAYVDEKILGNCPLTVKTVEQELLILPEHLSLPSVFSGVRITCHCCSYVTPEEWTVVYLYGMDIDFAFFGVFSIGFRNCFDSVLFCIFSNRYRITLRIVCRYQSGNQNQYIIDIHTIQLHDRSLFWCNLGTAMTSGARIVIIK